MSNAFMTSYKLTFRHFALLGLLMAFMAAPAWAQTDPESTDEETVTPADTTEISWRGKRYLIIKDESGKRVEIKDSDGNEVEEFEFGEEDEWDPNTENKEVSRRRSRSHVGGVAFDLGITNYYVDGNYGRNAAPEQLELREFRPGAHVALHILPTTVSLIGRGAVNLKTAITVDWNNYYYVNDVTLIEGPESIEFDTASVSLSKNKLMARYAQIPLLLNFNTAPGTDDGLRVSVGGYAGLLWRARTKQVSDANGTTKQEGEFNLNPYRYGLMARVDFRWFDIYLQYNLSELFIEGEGPSTQTFMAGINIIHF